MSNPFRRIDAKSFKASDQKFDPKTVGVAPTMKWIYIRELVIDTSYQREIGKIGRTNVTKIANEFHWERFACVIVAKVKGGKYAIIDGQHRVTAALVRGMAKVPCMIVTADREEQAAAFGAVNGNVTQITSMQLHHANVIAGEKIAVGLHKVCEAAGVNICRYPLAANMMSPGDTLAAYQLRKMYIRYGAKILQAALESITKTGDGNKGFVRAPIVRAFCEFYHDNPSQLDRKDRLDLVGQLTVSELFEQGQQYAREGHGKLPALITGALKIAFEEGIPS